MSTQIFYFSGTGNSLYVARELAKSIPNCTIVPIMAALNLNSYATEADTVGFVFPVHAYSLPKPVKQFISQFNFGASSYVFAVATRQCSSRVFREIDKCLSRWKRKLSSYYCIQAPDNYIPLFDCPREGEVQRFKEEVPRTVEKIETAVNSRQTHRTKDSMLVGLLAHVSYPVVRLLFQKTNYFNINNRFFADSKCDGCGICEKVCLADRIRMTHNAPEWNKQIGCTFCFACIHYCPTEAIQIRRSSTSVRGRYHYMGIGVEDIGAQKSWRHFVQ